MNARSDAMSLGAGQDFLQRLVELRRVAVERRGQPHRGMQIVWSYENRVDAFHAKDGMDVRHGIDVLGHDDDENLVVRLGVVGRGIGAEVRRVERAADAALADRAIARGLDHGLGFLAAVDHRHDDAPRAGIEHALDVLAGVPGDARERHNAVGRDDGEHLRGGLEGDGRVLQFDGQPFKAGLAHQVRAERVGQRDPGADGGFAALEFGTDGVGLHI